MLLQQVKVNDKNKMSENIGAIDVGTNTFHLIIVNWDNNTNQFKELVRKRFFVKLGAQDLFHIEEDAFQRGLKAMHEFASMLNQYDVKKIKAYGTSASRNANNADQFIDQVFKETGIQIEKISGDKEAELILKGTRLSYPFGEDPTLIMDIGGGSVEFIIADKYKIHFAQSFKVGVGLLKKQFHQNEPINETKIQELRDYLSTSLTPLIEAIKTYKPSALVGASGTFDVLEAAVSNKKLTPSASLLDTEEVKVFSDSVISKNLEERIQLSTIPKTRTDFIVVALILIDFVWLIHPFKKLVVSKYSMKEGILFEMMNQST